MRQKRLLEASLSLFEDLLCLGLVAPAGAGYFLVRLQVLLVDEEVLDFVLDVLLHIVDVLVALPARVIDDGE